MDASVPSGRPVASLTPTLLARKGGAKPAMRPQLGMAPAAAGAPETAALDDLGWNDFGPVEVPAPTPRVVAFPREATRRDAPAPAPLAESDSDQSRKAKSRKGRKSALARGGKAAFTLRLDAERHARLRLACLLDACSAQSLVTDALDRLLSEIPDLEDMAGAIARRQSS